MSVIVNFAIFPTDKGISVSPYVAKVVECVRKKGFTAQLTAMGTIVETETLAQALQIVDNAYALLEKDSHRVYCSANFDIQTNKPMGRMAGKIKSVEEKINNR